MYNTENCVTKNKLLNYYKYIIIKTRVYQSVVRRSLIDGTRWKYRFYQTKLE